MSSGCRCGANSSVLQNKPKLMLGKQKGIMVVKRLLESGPRGGHV